LTRSSGRRIRHLRGRARSGRQPVESRLADTGPPRKPVDPELINKWRRDSRIKPGGPPGTCHKAPWRSRAALDIESASYGTTPAAQPPGEPPGQPGWAYSARSATAHLAEPQPGKTQVVRRPRLRWGPRPLRAVPRRLDGQPELEKACGVGAASRLPLIGYSGRLRGHARKIVANQIDLICVPQLTSAKGRLAAQNGGSCSRVRCGVSPPRFGSAQ